MSIRAALAIKILVAHMAYDLLGYDGSDTIIPRVLSIEPPCFLILVAHIAEDLHDHDDCDRSTTRATVYANRS